MKSDTNVKLPLAFILYALAALVVAQFILFFNSDSLAAGQFRIPDIWMGAHFLLLGYAVMIAMGAMYQLVPVAFLTPIWSQKLGYLQFIITAVGITLFSILLGMKPADAIYGGILAITGIILFIFQMTKTILKQKEKSMMTYFVLAAITSFFLTVGAGFLLAWNIAYGGIGSHNTILYTHILLGITGWFTLLIFGFSYKLVPMFSLSHGYSLKWMKKAFFTYVTGLLLVISSLWLSFIYLETVGWFFLFLGFVYFVLDVKEILIKRIKKKLDKPFIFSLVAILNGLMLHFLALVLHLLSVNDAAVWSWLLFLYIMCWIIFSILGYLYKIVPFLWWTHKYADKIGKEKVPTLKEMINERFSVVLFLLFAGSVIGLTSGALLQIGVAVLIFPRFISSYLTSLCLNYCADFM
ncbi:hypothetical protein QGM71_08995 [Virgibacillus sp. C22-A2]|uniref:Cbb3-type cytochrome c oxidase subunit I n=2 Tax=Virgibacillus tibetensis TaxID=3042313 RepID=A0ABU6KEV2_9BACI|nr:hypothetical protein [Virgibacillus sp. C22-A2]